MIYTSLVNAGLFYLTKSNTYFLSYSMFKHYICILNKLQWQNG